MDPSATATELTELLDQARECARYLAELGVETIETPAFTIPAVEPIVPTALLGTDLRDRQLPTKTAAPVSRSPVVVPWRSRGAAQRSQDALFADLLPTPRPAYFGSFQRKALAEQNPMVKARSHDGRLHRGRIPAEVVS